MNITVYYHTRKIQLYQSSDTQAVKDLDLLSHKELKACFTEFIQQNDESVLNFKTLDMAGSLEKFKQAFRFIEAAGGLIEKDNKHLFIFRHQRWDLPKGKLDKKESPEDAAVRECEEECGITQLELGKLINHSYHIYEFKGDYAFKKTWWYAMRSSHTGILIPQTEEDISRVEWFDKEQIQQEVLKNTYPLITDILSQHHLI